MVREDEFDRGGAGRGDRGGAVVIARQVSPEVSERINVIKRFEGEYDELKGEQKRVKNSALIALALITLLVIFIAFWLAVYVARSIADPSSNWLRRPNGSKAAT